jgi:hypothetical protein
VLQLLTMSSARCHVVLAVCEAGGMANATVVESLG